MHSFFAQILCLASLLSQHSERQPPTNWDCKGGQYRETLGIHATSKNGVNGGYTFGEPYSVPINQLKLGLPSVNLTGTPLALHAELGTRASWESEADMKENAVIDRPLALAQQQQQQQPLMCRGERAYWPPSVMTQARQSLWSPTAKQSPGASSALIGIATPPKAAGC